MITTAPPLPDIILPTLTTAEVRKITRNIFPEKAGPSSIGRVLVVDDNASDRTLLTEWLTPYGHKVTVATSGLEALCAVELELPDAIVLDVKMQGMDGYAVCEKLKSDPRTAMIPILLLTSLHGREDRLRGMRAGANDFLLKPVDLPDLLLRVRNAVRISHLHCELESKLSEISRQEKFKENLVHMIVHDLRTPLAALDGNLQLMKIKADSKREDDLSRQLSKALQASRKLAGQIDMLLDIHRMEEGQMHVDKVALDLTTVVDNAVMPLRSLFGERRMHLEWPEHPIMAVGDAGLLGRVVANLLGNALAFTSPQTGEIFVRVLSRKDRQRVEVADNGPGIEMANQEAIFEKFGQVDEHSRSRSSGLGLTFCKLAVESQGGSIGVVSEFGSGAQFWFEVPAAE